MKIKEVFMKILDYIILIAFLFLMAYCHIHSGVMEWVVGGY
jgi:hypothetical protein